MRKSSARRPKRSAKSRKSKSNKRKRSVATKGSGGARKRSAPRSGAPSKSRVEKSKARPKAKVSVKAKELIRTAIKPAKAARVMPAVRPKPAPSKGSGRTNGLQGALDFERESTVTTYSDHAAPAPPPRRRSAAKPGSPDWPGDSLTVGMTAPEFSLPSTLGRKVTLSEFRGRRVILYFYPKDDTPGCTMEACAFRDNLPRIVGKDAVVLGVSLDDELSHQRFAQKYNLPFPLLADVDAAVSRQYGTYKEKNLYGRSYWGIERTTFVIDREGRVENVFRRVKVEGHAEEVMATLAI